MKKILLSLVVIAAVSAVAVGATRAWFTDSATLGSNTVASGGFAVEITDNPLTIANIMPKPAVAESYESIGKFAVSNTGDYGMKWRGKLNLTGGASLRDYIKVKAVLLPHGGIGDGQGITCNYGPSEGTELFSGVPLTELADYSDYLSLIPDGDPTKEFLPDHNACYEIFVRMDPEAPDSVQNKTLNADIIIEATQWNNPGWDVEGN